MENINEVEANEIDIKPFKVKDKLNPEFFNEEGQLNSQIRMRLLDIADDFVKTLEIKWIKPLDIVLTGSIANYNWSKFSDVDIHVIYKFKDVYEKTDFVKDYFNSKKELWNQTHDELTIKDFPVELSVEDSDDPAKSTGVYSLEKNKWVKEPENMNDSELNKEYIKDFCAKQMTKLDDLFKEMNSEKDRKKLEILSNKVEAIYTKLKNMRAEGLATKEKEMSTGNIIWKIVKHMGYINKLWDYINKVYDRRNTIDEKKVIRISTKQANLINEVYDASKLAKFGPVKRYFHYLNLELPLRGEYQLNPDDPKDKQIVCKCLSAVGSLRLKAQIHDKVRSGCIFGEDLVKYLGNFQNRNMLRNVIMKEKGESARKQEYSNIQPEDHTPAASNMDNFINLSDVSELNESIDEMSDFNNLYEQVWENSEVKPFDILMSYKNQESKTQDWTPLIKPIQYQNALRQYMQYGEAMRFPENVLNEWLNIIVRNTIRLDSNTELAGHSQWFPNDDFKDVYEEEYEQWCQNKGVDADYEYDSICRFLEEIGFYDWLKLPDGSDAWSDFGRKPIAHILSEYRYDMSAGEKLILINRCLDVYHCRGDLASAFIEGGSKSLTQASNDELFENIHRINEAALPQFNLQTIDSLKSFSKRLKYCQQMLGPTFGSGSSRVIFEIDDEKVLKLAKNQKGLAQNEFEEETSRYGDMVVKVFECGKDHTWLVEENCIPAKEEDFKRLIGLPFETYCDLVRYYYNRYCRNGKEVQLYTLSFKEAGELVDQLYDQDEYGFVPQVFNLMGDYQLPFGDLTRISTYGMVKRDGTPQIVIIDSGLSEEILNTYYRRK